MPKFSKIINDEDLKERTETDSPYYKKRITGFKNKIFPEDFTMSKEKEINLLREELKLTHKTYLSKIKDLEEEGDYMECRYNNLFVQFSKHRKNAVDFTDYQFLRAQRGRRLSSGERSELLWKCSGIGTAKVNKTF